MAINVLLTYNIGDVVWHVSTQTTAASTGTQCGGVKEAIVRTINVDINAMRTLKEYDIQYTDAFLGSATADEADLFPDVDSALTEYRSRIS